MRKSVIEPSNEITITPSTSPSVALRKTFISGMITPSMGPSVALRKTFISGMITPSMGPPVALRKIGKWSSKSGNREIEKSMMSFHRDFPADNCELFQ